MDAALEITSLTLAPDNPCNTTITSATGDPLYSVVTEHTKRTTFTTVRNAEDEIIGSLEWREVLPDKVTIGSSRPMSFADWVKKSKVPFKDHATFVDDAGRKYRWRGLAPGSSPELCVEDDNYITPIARFTKSRRIYPTLSSLAIAPSKERTDPAASMLSLSPTLTDTQSLSPTLTDANNYTPSLSTLTDSSAMPPRRFTPATLSLLPRALEVQDLVILSFLFLEKNRRSRDKSGFSNEQTSYGNIVPLSAC